MEMLDRGDGMVEENLPAIVHILEWVATGIDLMAIAVLLLGTVRFVAAFVPSQMLGRAERAGAMDRARVELGRYILTGLELFIVTDIIHTALSFALGDLVFLALLVAIRVVIGFFLDREIRQIEMEL